MDDGKSDEKAKETKKCMIKQILKFNDYEDCLLNNEIILKSQQSERHLKVKDIVYILKISTKLH